jgi:hypothetical protein
MQGAYLWASWGGAEYAAPARPTAVKVTPADAASTRRTSPVPRRWQDVWEDPADSWDDRPKTAPAKPQQTPSDGFGQATAAPTPTWQTFLEFFAAGKVRKAATAPLQQDNCQQETLVASMQRQLEETKGQPLAERKRVFRDLQRQLHPDKNIQSPEDAKLAFQELMLRRDVYLVAD